MSDPRPELRALTSVRGIAAWLVVLYHIRLSVLGLPQRWVAVFAKGYLAVDFFFLLSGFVMWLAWHERLRRDGLAGVPAFLKKRIARIWPLHAFLLAGAAAFALVLVVTGRPNDIGFPFEELPANLLLVQSWGFMDHLAWNVPAWSISVELAAYLLFPVIVLAVDWRRVPAVMLLVLAAALLGLLHLGFASHDAPTLGSDISRLGLIRCLVEFTVGTMLCALWSRWRHRPGRPAGGAALVAILSAAGWSLGLAETLVVPALFAAMLLVLALTSGRRGNPLEAGWLHHLGEISYATYLGHYLLFVGFKLVFVADPHAVPMPLVALFLALVLAMSIALYHLVERPAQRWIDAWPPAARRSPPRAGAAGAAIP